MENLVNIHFGKVVPAPLQALSFPANSVWGNTFTLTQGEKICLLAQSGKGKTTFTHILMGIRKDYSGTLSINEQAIRHFSQKDWAQLRKDKISVIFQDLQLFPALTVAENLQLKNELTQHYPLSKLQTFAARLGIAEKWDTPCEQLSLGQQQRVAIIRALCQPFNWLVMDEPFSHLDQENTALAFALIEEVCQTQKAGMILTSLDEITHYSFDQTLIL